MTTNPFTLEPCKTCGRAETITGTQMKKEILDWVGYDLTRSYGSSLSRGELLAIYSKIFREEKG